MKRRNRSAGDNRRQNHVSIPLDPLASRSGFTYGNLNFPVFLHGEVSDSVANRPPMRKRLALVLQHLAAHGRAGVVKGCSDTANRGWRRTPLGGAGGMQFYLWWAPADSPQVSVPPDGDPALNQGIWVRAVRHHDDMRPLRAGDTGRDYFELNQEDMDGSDDTFVASPWTDQQLEFVNSHDPVRIVYGYPGSGKTTALWRAVESRDDERVLYASWSRELVRFAGEHLASFAPSGVEVIHHDFLTLLGVICGYDIPRLTQERSMSALAEAIGRARMGRATIGPWADRVDALYAEMRAVLFGMAVEESKSTTTAEGLRRLVDSDYLSMRSGEDGVGARAASSLLEIAATLERRGALGDIFPELAGAARSLDRLSADALPDGFSDMDRVVVDEAQDLTLVEAAVFVELCRAIARHRRHSPRLLLAGDEGQTVRPSGFNWGALNGLLASSPSRPSCALRSPSRL